MLVKLLRLKWLKKLLSVYILLAFTKNNIASRFNKTGIWSLNFNILNEIDFLSSNFTDRSMKFNVGVSKHPTPSSNEN